MTRLKKSIGYTFLAIFVGTFIMAMLAALGKLPDSGVTLWAFVTAFLGECLVAVTAAFKAPNYFDDPPAITRLKEEHVAEMTRTKEASQQEIARITKSHSDQQQKDQQTIAELNRQLLGFQRHALKPRNEIISIKNPNE